ncbi:MAG: cellulase family glycosylhydrolase, partial [Microbacteriaceae bacterium]|nr:cellulase family glycosylhydrolase [Microbacteriaceae bacterium]
MGAVVVPLVLAGTSGSVAEARAAAQAEAEAAGEIPAGFLRAQGERIADGRGNQVLLRGVNVNQLVDFYQHRPDVPKVRPLDDADFAQMASYGFNVVRLGLSWSALEPVQGELDAEYLARIREAVDDAAAHGIYTV